MQEYLNLMLQELGIPTWLFIIMITWTSIWKFVALWKAAKKDSLPWFIILAIFNTMGILEILYVYVFSKMECCDFHFTKRNVKKKKNSKQRKKRK